MSATEMTSRGPRDETREEGLQQSGEEKELTGKGNGPINAFVHALEQEGLKDFKLTDYRQHSIGEGSATESAAYVQLQTKVGRVATDAESIQVSKKADFSHWLVRIIGQGSIARKKDFLFKFNESGTFLVIVDTNLHKLLCLIFLRLFRMSATPCVHPLP